MTYEKIIATWNEFVLEFPDAIDLEEFDLLKEVSYIKKVGSDWCVFGDSGRRMGCYSSRKRAEERLAQVEMFKHIKGIQDNASRNFCICQDCNSEFATPEFCDLATCPVCGGHNIEEEEDEKGSMNYCLCNSCGAEFVTSIPCDDAKCPECGDRDAVDI